MTISITKPTVGGSENTWGTTTNQALDDIVDVLNGNTASTPDLTAGSWKVGGTAITADAAELNHTDGVTSNIQTQLDDKAALAGSTSQAFHCNVLTVDGGAASYIYMNDSNHGNRIIHCNDNRIGFLTQAGGWGTYSDDNGNWVASGDVTAYSDARLKDNVQTINGALDKVLSMRGVTFDKGGQRGTGVIAQEMQEVMPEVVMQNDEYLSVAYGNLVGVLIEAVKELCAEVEEIKRGQ
jgi:hypothetical protein